MGLKIEGVVWYVISMSLRTLAPAIDKNNKANAKKHICRPKLFSPHFPRLRLMFLGGQLL